MTLLPNMELLLNLVWLLLAVPAYWLWRESGQGHSRRNFNALQVLLALGCAIVLLFPVISATDDLHAMRAEIEEPSSSKRSVRQASHDKNSTSNVRLSTPPAVVESFAKFAPDIERAGITLPLKSYLPVEPVFSNAGRAPPVDNLV